MTLKDEIIQIYKDTCRIKSETDQLLKDLETIDREIERRREIISTINLLAEAGNITEKVYAD